MSLEEISSVIQCYAEMLDIMRGERGDTAAIPGDRAHFGLDRANDSPGLEYKLPFAYSPQSLRFCIGSGGFDPMTPLSKSIRKELPMTINGVAVVARPDSAAGGNFMSKELLCYLNLDLSHDANDKRLFILGNGKTVKSIGRSYASCSFAKDTTMSVGCWFNVLSDLSTSLIMGNGFLEETQTLSKNRHRLRDRTVAVSSIPVVNSIEPKVSTRSKRHFGCVIDNRNTIANPDTASDLDLVSSKYASTYRYKVMGRKRQIQLADKSTCFTSGKILVTLELADGRKYLQFFDVLPGLDSDIVLGEDTLESIEAFTKLSESFVDVDIDTNTPAELKIIADRGKLPKLLTRSNNRADNISTQPIPSSGGLSNEEVYANILREDSPAGDPSVSQPSSQYCQNLHPKSVRATAHCIKPLEALFVGSSPLVSETEFFVRTTRALGKQSLRIPDGQPYPLPLAKIPEPQEEGKQTRDGSVGIYQLKDVKPAGYGSRAIASYATFRDLKDAGTIPSDVRFQVMLPTPLSMVTMSVKDDRFRAQIEKLHETRLRQDLHHIQKSIPASELTIQWDLMAEIATREWQHGKNQLGQPQSSIEARLFDPLTRLASSVDPAVEMGFHLGFGDSNHIQFEPPAEAGSLLKAAVEVANTLVQKIEPSHHVEYVHLPIPKDGIHKEFFMPLGNLALRDTKLFLGVIYANDGLGTEKRLDAARAIYPNIAGVGPGCRTARMSEEAFGNVLDTYASLR